MSFERVIASEDRLGQWARRPLLCFGQLTGVRCACECEGSRSPTSLAIHSGVAVLAMPPTRLVAMSPINFLTWDLSMSVSADRDRL